MSLHNMLQPPQLGQTAGLHPNTRLDLAAKLGGLGHLAAVAAGLARVVVVAAGGAQPVPFPEAVGQVGLLHGLRHSTWAKGQRERG